ncbi:hypothetical protein F2Q69_00007421 [Brassica cretica]|uniref:Uncharacterized protein n=1 Tax=Brassica cretica TaxID=69181 RepID=A0A8S9P800_BRACR|nr:hypothetical protein F2Q69_00007421 [Brassica cretica]
MVAMDKYDKPSEAVRGGIKPPGISINRQGRASKLVEARPVLPCPRGRTIYVISIGLEACSANHPAIQESTRDIGGSSERIESESPETDKKASLSKNGRESWHPITMPSLSRFP